MKTFKFYLILLLALILIQCNVKTINQPTPVPSDEETVIRELMDEQEDIVANQPIAMAANMPEENDTILIEVKNYESNLAMGEVKIEVKRDDITISNTTTDNKGEAIVSNVNATNEYIFSKENFSSQRISFVDFNTIDRINVYLKPQGGNSSDSTNVSGFVYNKEGKACNDVTVKFNGKTVTTKDRGKYSLNILRPEGVDTLDYSQGEINGSLKLNAEEDSIMVDVFIDGFSAHRVPVGN